MQKMPKAERKKRVLEMAERVGLTREQIDRYPGELSGGQRQRAYLAMALAQQGDVLLLDEPTAGLDIAAQLEFLALCRTLADAGRTMVLVLHDVPQALRYADHMILMQGGRLFAEDTPDAVFASRAAEQVFGVAFRRAEDGNYYVAAV